MGRRLNSIGDFTRFAVPSRQGVIYPSTAFSGDAGWRAFIGQLWASDRAAQLLERLAVVSTEADGGARAEAIDVGTQALLKSVCLGETASAVWPARNGHFEG